MKILDSQRLRLVLIGLLGLVSLGLLLIIIFSPAALTAKSNDLVKLKLQSKVVDAQLAGLAQAKKDVAQYSYFNDVAKTVFPTDKNQAQAVLDINQFASESGILISSITFPASNLGSKAAASASDATTASPQTAISQAKPVEGIPGLYGLDLTINTDSTPTLPDDKKATYTKMIDFLSRIERNRRTAQITQLNIIPITVETGPTSFISFSLTTRIFLKP